MQEISPSNCDSAEKELIDYGGKLAALSGGDKNLIEAAVHTAAYKQKQLKTVASIVEDELDAAIEKDAVLGKIPAQRRKLLSAVFLPKIGSGFAAAEDGDLQLLKEAYHNPALEDVLRSMGPAAAMRLTREGRQNPQLLIAKKQKATEILPSRWQFVSERMDLWRYREEFVLHEMNGTKIVLRDELDRWKFFFSDPRAYALRKALTENKVSPTNALEQFDLRIRDLGALYKLQKESEQPSVKTMCTLLGYGSSDSMFNINFRSALDSMVELAQKNPDLTQDQMEACRYEVGRALWDMHRKEAYATTEKEVQEHNREASKRVLDLLVDKCPRFQVEKPGQFSCEAN
jgi:hypothetical protein